MHAAESSPPAAREKPYTIDDTTPPLHIIQNGCCARIHPSSAGERQDPPGHRPEEERQELAREQGSFPPARRPDQLCEARREAEAGGRGEEDGEGDEGGEGAGETGMFQPRRSTFQLYEGFMRLREFLADRWMQRKIQAIKDKRAAKEEKERYELLAAKMHAKRVERLRRREKRNKMLKS